MATTIVSRTQSGSESAAGRRTWTFSCWFKRTKLSSSQELFGSDANGARSNNYNIIDLNASDQIDFAGYESGITFRKTTNRRFRDTNAWYHLVIAFDSTQSTADDRIKIYINGTRETSFGTSTNPAQDHQSKFFSSGKVHAFGRSSQTFDGVISHCHATEGTAYAPTVFGSTDATTGEWKINTNPSVSYGTNGFFLFKNDNAVTNQAGNSSGNFTVTAGTLSKTEDNPSNVFAVINNNTFPSEQVNIGYGATAKTNTPTTNQWRTFYGTIGASSGKYYFEMKVNNIENTDPNNFWVGIVDADQMYDGSSHHRSYQQSRGYCYHAQTGNQGNNNSTSSYGNSWTTNDIVGVAMDLDNSKLYFSKNGTWQNSGVPTSGSTGTGAISIASGYTYLPNFSQYYGNEWFSVNFGNGSFQGTAVSSAGTNASNIGIFEYDVPSGYTALCTKGLNE